MTKYIGDSLHGAYFSRCRQWRYTLWRRFIEGCPVSRMCCFIGLNPSTADESQNDPTIRRCIRFSDDWGFDGYIMLNLFAYRATKPADMKRFHSPVGEENPLAIMEVCRDVPRIVAAWGTNGAYRLRGMQTQQILSQHFADKLFVLRTTKKGHPEHPLYVPSVTVPQLWIGAR